jgi:hypothetical protein
MLLTLKVKLTSLSCQPPIANPECEPRRAKPIFSPENQSGWWIVTIVASSNLAVAAPE